MPTRGTWRDLPRALIADDLKRLAAEFDALPPRPVRARIEAESVRVIPVAELRSLTYAAGSQRLEAVIADAAGQTATVSAVHEACAPGRLDAMAAAFEGSVRFVAGAVRRSGGGLLLDPTAFATDDDVIIPDLTAPTGAAEPDSGARPPGDPLDEALSLLVNAAHQGLQQLPLSMPDRLRAAAQQLTTVGLSRAGESVTAFAAALGHDPTGAGIESWVDAHLRLSLLAEMR